MDASLIAYTSQRSLFNRLEIVSNNVANANTSGFKSELAVYLKPQGIINGEANPVPNMKVATDLTNGNLAQTDRQLDVAIQGEGFFQVETPLGARYTRSGAFVTDASGALVTKEGYPVVGDGGPINLDPNDSQFRIGEDGTILAITPEGEQVRGKIGVFKLNDRSNLQKAGNSYFTTTETADTAEARVDYVLAQGMIETSNVNQIKEISEMVDISRTVQSIAKIIQDQHQLIKSAVQRISSV